MSRPQASWGHAEWIDYFRGPMLRSIETDIRHLLATGGSFGVPRQFFPHVEYLSGLVFGPVGGRNLSDGSQAEDFLDKYLGQVAPLYRQHRRILMLMWRHGVIHTYQRYDPKRFPSPTQPPPDLVSPAFEHMLAFGVLAGLLFFSLRISRFRVKNIPVTVLLIAMCYGAMDEWLQALPFINRDCEFADWMADVTGAALAVVILTHLVRSTQRYTVSS